MSDDVPQPEHPIEQWSDQIDTLGSGATIADRYKIIRVLGEGGMGQVFEVEHISLGRRFALKVLRASIWTEELSRRFQREARALAQLTSPRVVQITDFGIDTQVGPFYVMELLNGETLDARLRTKGRLPSTEVLRIGIELCQALEEVHVAGIVHRDLKPANIGLVDGPTPVKLLDFGLAVGLDGNTAVGRMTVGQGMFGTLPYMSPEQCRGEPPTPSMDLYALGIILFELLTGQVPFQAPTPLGMVSQHLGDPVPDIKSIAPDVVVPAWLEKVIRQLLAKDASARPPSASAVATALFGGGAEHTDYEPTLPPRATPIASKTTAPKIAPEPLIDDTKTVTDVRVQYPAAPHGPPAASRKQGGLVAIVIVVLLAAAGAAYWFSRQPVAIVEAPAPTPAPTTAPEPKVIVTPLEAPAPKPTPLPESALAPPMITPTPTPPTRSKPKKKKAEWNGEIVDAP